MKDAYKTLIEDLVNERMDKIVIHHKKFRKADKKYKVAIKRCNELMLSKDDALVVDRAISAFAAQSAIYAEIAYRQGMRDAVKLLKEIGAM